MPLVTTKSGIDFNSLVKRQHVSELNTADETGMGYAVVHHNSLHLTAQMFLL